MKTTTLQIHQLLPVNWERRYTYIMYRVLHIYLYHKCFWCIFPPYLLDVPASTPAPVAQNEVDEEDDDDEPPLNENDDDDLDDLDQGEDQNTHHLVLAQFDKVATSFFHFL